MGLETLNNLGVKHPFKAKYDNYIGGEAHLKSGA